MDIVTGCDYFKFEPWERLVFLGEQYNFPVYACIESRRIAAKDKQDDDDYMLRRWRGEASLAWQSGVDGIYTFNKFESGEEIFNEIGDLEKLLTLPRIEYTAYVEESSWSVPETWAVNGRSYIIDYLVEGNAEGRGLLREKWLWEGTGGGIAEDINRDGCVNLYDFVYLAEDWISH